MDADPFAACEALASMVVVAGVGVALAGQPVHASIPLVRDVEQQQYVLGEGPAIDAYRTRLPVEAVRGALGGSWLELDLDALGIGSVLACPLMVDGRTCLGAMTLYRRQAVGFSAHQRALVLGVAGQAAIGIGQLIVSSRLADVRHPSLRALDELRQAIGIVMAQLTVGAGEASARLRAHAYATGRPLDDVVAGLRNHAIRLADDFSEQPGGA
jgi:GAF domain-containing protein